MMIIFILNRQTKPNYVEQTLFFKWCNAKNRKDAMIHGWLYYYRHWYKDGWYIHEMRIFNV